MENIVLFIITVLTYSFLVYIVLNPYSQHHRFFYFTEYLKVCALMAFLCLPLNVNEDIYTIAGNVVSKKSIYSVASLYQSADKEAMNIIGILAYQNAGKDVVTLFGISLYQNAGRSAGTLMGISGYQKAEIRVITVIGVGIYQSIPGKQRSFGAFSELSK